MALWSRFRHLLTRLRENPPLLKGTSHRHERSFERLLHEHTIPCSPSAGYLRHPNGPNRWPDFQLHDEQRTLPVELKTTGSDLVHLGQTWIQSHGLYVISHRKKTGQPAVFIAFGKDMKTEEEDRAYEAFHAEVVAFRRRNRTLSPLFHSDWSIRTRLRYRIVEEDAEACFRRVMDVLPL